MHEYDEAVLRCFLENQGQLFPEDVAANEEEAEAFLEDCMAVVVEGVENKEHLALMHSCNCSIAQGYYFSKPLDPETFAELYAHGKL